MNATPKVALVTGASSGFGQSTSGTLPPQGALATVGRSSRGVSTAAVSARNARELCRLVCMVLTISLSRRG